ncbi:hypothetical protein C8R45DRAFT_1162124 [Mycena sanguinolenta]|nr:hypothetical protein C8R45DRAFT_1162124 [Mycena sanguinolenta]
MRHIRGKQPTSQEPEDKCARLTIQFGRLAKLISTQGPKVRIGRPKNVKSQQDIACLYFVIFLASTAEFESPVRRPEVREKQRIRMAEKRQVMKARRRQWDPPKVPKVGRQIGRRSHRMPSPLPTSPVDQLPADVSLTSAEHLALTVLAGMAGGHSIGSTPLSIQSRCSSVPPDTSSSAAAVREEQIHHQVVGQLYQWIKHPLPRYLAPETALQNKMRLELGKFGPLTPVQSAQFEAYRLGTYASRYVKKLKTIKEKLKSAPFLSRTRWESIRAWRKDHQEYDTDWDEEVRQELAELRGMIGHWTEPN